MLLPNQQYMPQSNFSSTKVLKNKALLYSVLFWVLFTVLLIGSSQLTHIFPRRLSSVVFGVFGLLCAVILTVLFLRHEKASLQQTGLTWKRNTVLKFLLGIGIGILVFSFIISVLLLFTELQIQKSTKKINEWHWLGLLSLFLLSWMEEIAFRSYTFLKLKKAFGFRATQWIVAIGFALYHVPNQSFISSFIGPAIFSFVFGLGAAWSGGIALPTGIHTTLNILQALLGMKGDGYAAFWTLHFPSDTSGKMIAQVERFGLASHLIVLITALVLTEVYIRQSIKKAE